MVHEQFSRVLLTGATGFLGRYLVAELRRNGYQVRALTRRPGAYTWLQRCSGVEIVQGDVREPASLQQAVDGCDRVIHAAALFSMWAAAGDFHAHNVQGTANMLAAAAEAGVKRFVYVSTVAAVGQPENGRIIDEQHPLNPHDPYQHSKVQAEKLVLSPDSGLDALVVRPGAFYGPLGDYAFNRLFFTDPRRGIIMQMDGGRYIIFPAYAGDVAAGIIAAMERGRSGEIYNLCGECLSHREAFDIVCELADLHWPRLNIPGFIGINFSRLLELIARITGREPFWPIGLRSYVFNDWQVSSAKAEAEIGFRPLSFREGAKRTLEWYRAGRPDSWPDAECPADDPR